MKIWHFFHQNKQCALSVVLPNKAKKIFLEYLGLKSKTDKTSSTTTTAMRMAKLMLIVKKQVINQKKLNNA